MKRRHAMHRHRTPAPASLFCLLLCIHVAHGADSSREQRYFETHVRPFFAEHCWKCHGEKKQKGGLRLDSSARIARGGESGPAVQPGDAEASLLIQALRYESLQMPPSGRLPDELIDPIARWVEAGARWPGEINDVEIPQRRGRAFSDEDRSYWAFQPIVAGVPPAVQHKSWVRNPIDQFVLARLEHHAIDPSPEADRRTLIRRVTFDLTGLPPTWQQIEAFVADDLPLAYERLVNRLLSSPRYGEHQARLWLDLVRYAESDGYKQDAYRPQAWRYRDYVIDSFNDDKPYDQFVVEQLAGDEVDPHDPIMRVATSYYRHGIYEYNQRDVRTQWDTILNDITNVTADVFLGMGYTCARCHDHKFDPILQTDYFRLKAFFAPILPRDDLFFASRETVETYVEQLAQWNEETAAIRKRLDEIEAVHRNKAAEAAVNKFPEDIREILRQPKDQRNPLANQLAALAYRQVKLEYGKDLPKKAQTEAYQALQDQLAAYEQRKPQAPPRAFTITDVGSVAPPTRIPKKQTTPIAPGFLSIFDPQPAPIIPPPNNQASTGRRLALARWLVDPSNPLTRRVIVNRVWQQHFGRAIVSTPNDFGQLGQPPTHPDLLDWLADRLFQDGWRLKELHRLVVTSATYRQAAASDATNQLAMAIDPENRLLWRRTPRRLNAEQIRDASLATSGELDTTMGGPSRPHEQPRRSIYTKVMRNHPDPLIATHDGADNFTSTATRNVTTTPTQALMMINGQWMWNRADHLARQLETVADTSVFVRSAYRSVLGRYPSASELRATQFFLLSRPGQEARLDLCHVLLNSNEFLYID